MKPRIFIASSVEGKPIAEALQANLDYDAHCTVWDQAFTLSVSTIDMLFRYCAENDFAIFVFSKDDVAKIRGTTYMVARDNVLFESGLFMGMHYKDSAFIVIPRETPPLHIPTDLLGLTTANYDAARAQVEARAALGYATTEIKKAIEQSAWTHLKPTVFRKGTAGGKTYPLKMRFDVVNNYRDPFVFQSLAFDLNDMLRLHDRAPKLGARHTYRPELRIRQIVKPEGTKDDEYSHRCIIEAGQTLISWVPLDPSIEKATIENPVTPWGVWHYRCSWLRESVSTYKYAEPI